MLVLTTLPQMLEFARDHVFRRRDPGLGIVEANAVAMFERPRMERVARSEIDVGFELIRVMDLIERASRTARGFQP